MVDRAVPPRLVGFLKDKRGRPSTVVRFGTVGRELSFARLDASRILLTQPRDMVVRRLARLGAVSPLPEPLVKTDPGRMRASYSWSFSKKWASGVILPR
jgi:hypothetical protein